VTLAQEPWQEHYAAAVAAVEREQWREAQALLLQVLQQQPDHGSAHHLLGRSLRGQGAIAQALAAQQRSCQCDPALGWNWFASGELLTELKRWPEAAQAFEQALQVLPAQDWIAHQLQQARVAAVLADEDRHPQDGDALGQRLYSHWIRHHESQLPDPLLPVQQPFWLLQRDGSWRALHATAALTPPTLALGGAAWPADGWLVLLGDGALLRAGALQALEAWLQDQADVPDLLYCDEDQIDQDHRRGRPWFKPGWVEESFWSSPWLGAFSVWRMRWLAAQRLPLPGPGSVDRFGWILQALNQQPRVGHVAQVLVHQTSTTGDPELSMAAQQAHMLCQHIQQRREPLAAVRPHASLPGCFSLQWKRPAQVRCAVIIPTRDRADLLEQCLESVWHTTAAERSHGVTLEWIVVDNGSKEAATAALLRRWKTRLGAGFHVLRSDAPFNWSRLNNLAIAATSAEIVLLLNNDIEATSPGWLEVMLQQALRPRVGCVGALLLYPDGTIQHSGVVIGLHSGADHAYRGLLPDHAVHHGRSRLHSAWGAVTGACMMVRREWLVRCGGFDEGLPVEFNDVDFCLQLDALGLRHVIPEGAVLIHHESQSRDALGSSTAAPALARLSHRWGRRLQHSAPWWPAQSADSCDDGRPAGLEHLTLAR
jgi:GT2 family glycosyltransferase/tetratricopeptide (TPR) repeat protein